MRTRIDSVYIRVFLKMRSWATLVYLSLMIPAYCQFKEIGPPPFPPAVARQKISALLEEVNASNYHHTIESLTGLVPWYRETLDEELIAAWKRDSRTKVSEVLEALVDERVASAVVGYSWREQRQAVFALMYAPLLGHLMGRYPQSAEPFLEDLRGPVLRNQPSPVLSQDVAEAVCRILVDMPDIGTWRQSAQHILPRYPEAAKRVLLQDLSGPDEAKSYGAQVWLRDLKMGVPSATVSQEVPLRNPASPPQPDVDGPRRPVAFDSLSPRTVLPSIPVPLKSSTYNGPQSGTFESKGSPIPQNAEYIFRNLPPVKLHLDYDTKVWDVHIVSGEGQTQRLLVKNKSSGPQKKCLVHWSIVP